MLLHVLHFSVFSSHHQTHRAFTITKPPCTNITNWNPNKANSQFVQFSSIQTSHLPNQNTKTKHPITLHAQHERYTAPHHRPTRFAQSRDTRVCSIYIPNMYTNMPKKVTTIIQTILNNKNKTQSNRKHNTYHIITKLL
jgi:hypothetical protein